MIDRAAPEPAGPSTTRRPRIGCIGAGWIGRSRLAALVAAGIVDVIAVVDPDPSARQAVRALSPQIGFCPASDDLLAQDLDGVVIATPSALHFDQAGAALRAGHAVFCQKPLARTAGETRELVGAAASADRLLAVDLSYRHTRAAQALRDAVRGGDLGRVHAIELVFHNAYGPDKPWFTRRSLSGGGCLIDLGTHLLDLALWLTDAAGACIDTAHLTRSGERLIADDEHVEDFALAQLHTDNDVVVRLACSWFLPAGRDCVFEATAYGTEGAATMRNVDGSFYDFTAARHRGTQSETLVQPPDDWGGRAIGQWAVALEAGGGFDPSAWELASLAHLIDRIYETA